MTIHGSAGMEFSNVEKKQLTKNMKQIIKWCNENVRTVYNKFAIYEWHTDGVRYAFVVQTMGGYSIYRSSAVFSLNDNNVANIYRNPEYMYELCKHWADIKAYLTEFTQEVSDRRNFIMNFVA